AAEIRQFIVNRWNNYFAGQFWVGGWYWGGAWSSFFREICKLSLKGDLWSRAQAYEATMESACWWWPHRDFVIVSERPNVIATELVDQARPRGWNSHRLHNDTGPAVGWQGFGVWAIHGTRVPQHVVERPETITVAEVEAEANAEVRRVMIDRYGQERYLVDAGAETLATDRFGTLYRKTVAGDEPIVMVKVRNSTPEPDGSIKDYFLRVPPDMRTAQEAVAWTFGLDVKEYQPAVET
ncbi:MAG TPA: hypothetical protein VHQ92_01100, partial [Pseudolabrys sp.]|nr:hypothetical protein [Pseudolabrys sp.]